MNHREDEMNGETIRCRGDVKLFTRSWSPAGPPRAVVVLVHGFKAHGGLFGWAAEHLAAEEVGAPRRGVRLGELRGGDRVAEGQARRDE